MHDEDLAIIEIRQLSDNARMFLQHHIRNSLQVIRNSIEMNDKAAAIDEIWCIKNKLAKIGL